jgi:hypothetical protein
VRPYLKNNQRKEQKRTGGMAQAQALNSHLSTAKKKKKKLGKRSEKAHNKRYTNVNEHI